MSNLSGSLAGMGEWLECTELGSSRPGTNANEVYIRQNRTFYRNIQRWRKFLHLDNYWWCHSVRTNGQPSMEQFNMLDPSGSREKHNCVTWCQRSDLRFSLPKPMVQFVKTKKRKKEYLLFPIQVNLPWMMPLVIPRCWKVLLMDVL